MKVPESCKGCIRWEQFKEDCWVYWEQKKECTMHSDKLENFVY